MVVCRSSPQWFLVFTCLLLFVDFVVGGGFLNRMKHHSKKCAPEVVAIRKTKIVPVAVPIKSKKKVVELHDTKIPDMNYHLPNFDLPPSSYKLHHGYDGDHDDDDDEESDPYASLADIDEHGEESETVKGNVMGAAYVPQDDDGHDDGDDQGEFDGYDGRADSRADQRTDKAPPKLSKRAGKAFFAYREL